jgi:hypothetical protein
VYQKGYTISVVPIAREFRIKIRKATHPRQSERHRDFTIAGHIRQYKICASDFLWSGTGKGSSELSFKAVLIFDEPTVYAYTLALKDLTMRYFALIIMLCLLAGTGMAKDTFELEDPAQILQEDIKDSEKAVLQQEKTSGVYLLKNSDYLKLFVGNYVHGFREFDTTVTASSKSVSVGVYYDPNTQDKGRAEQLAKRFRTQLPIILGDLKYQWSRDVEIVVNVYSEDRLNGF